jgi:prohibitin 2
MNSNIVPNKISPAKLLLIVLVVLIISFFMFDVVKVNERQVTVITRFGKVTDSHGPGWHLKIPVIDQVATTYDAGVQSLTVESNAATKDQQSVVIKINVQYKLDPTKAKELYQLVKNQNYFDESVIPPFIQESLKASSAKFTATELLEQRDVLKSQVEEALQKRLSEYFSTVVSVNIVNIDWSEQFDKAIEAKVIAEQQALTKKQELEQTKIQAEIDITKAQAEAESTKIRGQAIKENPETLEKAKIDKWDGKLPQVQGTDNAIINLKP